MNSEKTIWTKFDVNVPMEIKEKVARACRIKRRSVSGWAWENLQKPYLRLCAEADAMLSELQDTGLAPVKSGGVQPCGAGLKDSNAARPKGKKAVPAKARGR